MGVIAIACYVTERASYAMRAKDGTVVEVFEWISKAAIDGAHTNAAVQTLWAEYGAVCDYVSLNSLAEANDMFAMFDPI